MLYTYQKKLKGEKVGIVFGTFAPMHQGHLDVIMRAKKECDGGCIVLVDGRDDDRGGDSMPLKLRYRYIREFLQMMTWLPFIRLMKQNLVLKHIRQDGISL